MYSVVIRFGCYLDQCRIFLCNVLNINSNGEFYFHFYLPQLLVSKAKHCNNGSKVVHMCGS